MLKACEDGLNEFSGCFGIFLSYVGSLIIEILSVVFSHSMRIDVPFFSDCTYLGGGCEITGIRLFQCFLNFLDLPRFTARGIHVVHRRQERTYCAR